MVRAFTSPVAEARGFAAETHSLPEPTPRARRFYRPELDVIRSLAFLLVLTHHLLGMLQWHAPLDHFSVAGALEESGAAGVCLFFTLSAFLITELLLREKEATGTIALPAFYLRRILRIWPLYFLGIGLGVALPHVAKAFAGHMPPMVHAFSYVGGFVLPYLLLVGNWAIVAKGWSLNPMLMPLWSISVEEQFYLLWPSMVRRAGIRGIAICSSAVLLLAWATDFLLPLFHYSKYPDLWYNSVSHFQFFALGTLLALCLHRRELTYALPWRALALAGAVGFFVLAAYPFHYREDLVLTAPAATFAGYLCLDLACLLVFGAFVGLKLPRAAKPLVYMGKISFGLYVFHDTILSAVAPIMLKKLHVAPSVLFALAWLTTLGLSVAVASLSYSFFEKPFLRLKDRFTLVPSRAA
ncbi:acyltransferase [Acidipila sp. EB88]|uniref:acyltransferase family protein n=1 Tax=Acidipila sp. EB88 TaxID=2305226 RepID=UPI000F5EDDEA|nr:acyltransferase [Acidipila sp. EB88]RRA48947.1 acyltransferase [Acidipila sp. EB88]